MKQSLLALLFIVITSFIMGQSLKLNQLEGKWLVNYSNFPMWTKGNKTNPSFNYSVFVRHGKPGLVDEVVYTRKSKTKRILGFDKPTDENNRSFTWRGKGVLGFVKSKWSILYFDEEQQWMIIHFEKTLFTPGGYDVVSRSESLTGDLEKEVLKKMVELGIAEKLIVIRQE